MATDMVHTHQSSRVFLCWYVQSLLPIASHPPAGFDLSAVSRWNESAYGSLFAVPYVSGAKGSTNDCAMHSGARNAHGHTFLSIKHLDHTCWHARQNVIDLGARICSREAR